MRHRSTGQSRCFGFIDYSYAHSAASALISMDGQCLLGDFRERPMWVRPSVRAQQLQEGALSSFSPYGLRPEDIPSISAEATDRCSSAALKVAVIPLAEASPAGTAVLGDADGSGPITDEVEAASAVQLDSSQSAESAVKASATMPVVRGWALDGAASSKACRGITGQPF